MHEVDLALVEVMEGLEDVEPVPLPVKKEVRLPKLREKVYVLGFPVGGNDLSITEGVVSRIEVQVRPEWAFPNPDPTFMDPSVIVCCPWSSTLVIKRKCTTHGTSALFGPITPPCLLIHITKDTRTGD